MARKKGKGKGRNTNKNKGKGKKTNKNKGKKTSKNQGKIKPGKLFDGLDNGKRSLIYTITFIAWIFIGIVLTFITNPLHRIYLGQGLALLGLIYIVSVGSTCSAYINGKYEGNIESLRSLVATTQVSVFGFIVACGYLLYDKLQNIEFTLDSLLGNGWQEIGISLLKWISIGVYISMMIIVLLV